MHLKLELLQPEIGGNIDIITNKSKFLWIKMMIHSCCPLTPTTAAAVPGSYTTVMWQYDHEKNGSRWHNYQFAPDGSNSNFIMEDIYQQIRSFSSLGTTSVLRKVKSGREWEYEVNFNSMSQKNLGHSAHQVRNIRRLENGSRCQCSECTANSAFANIIRK